MKCSLYMLSFINFAQVYFLFAFTKVYTYKSGQICVTNTNCIMLPWHTYKDKNSVNPSNLFVVVYLYPEENMIHMYLHMGQGKSTQRI